MIMFWHQLSFLYWFLILYFYFSLGIKLILWPTQLLHNQISTKIGLSQGVLGVDCILKQVNVRKSDEGVFDLRRQSCLVQLSSIGVHKQKLMCLLHFNEFYPSLFLSWLGSFMRDKSVVVWLDFYGVGTTTIRASSSVLPRPSKIQEDLSGCSFTSSWALFLTALFL